MHVFISRPRRLLLIAAAALSLPVAHVAATTAGSGEERSPTDWSRARAVLATRAVEPLSSTVTARAATPSGARGRALARERLRVLRQPRHVAADAVSPGVAAQPTLADGAVDLSAARRVRGSDGEPAWIAPSSDGSAVCAVRAGAVACPPVALLTVTGLSPGLIGRAGEPYRVWGIAGDDVSSLVLVEGDGTRVSVTITDNFFDLATDDWPRALTWTGPSGPESFTFPPNA